MSLREVDVGPLFVHYRQDTVYLVVAIVPVVILLDPVSVAAFHRSPS
jgi:hypothetical protein